MIQLLLAIIYLSFISLGLPDALLGAAWPSIYLEMGVPVSYAGVISMIIAAGTIVSSLQSDRLTKRLGTGRVTAVSVAMTAAALFGFSASDSFLALCLWAIPYGLGAGSVDASLNNYVALHYASRHMSWLHCMWGVGTCAGPYLMGYALSSGSEWNRGYFYVALIQIVLTAVLICTLPLWKKRAVPDLENKEPGISEAIKQSAAGPVGQDAARGTSKSAAQSTKLSAAGASEQGSIQNILQNTRQKDRPFTLKEIFAIPGAKAVMAAFFCYCALEQTVNLWASSYLTLCRGASAETAAGFAAMFFLGITGGRAASGFLTMKLNDKSMVRLGLGFILLGIAVTLLPFGKETAFAGLVLIGLGCAPVYPCMIHDTPSYFGADKSQAIIGVQMASAYLGTCLMPPLFGLLANHISAELFPFYLLLIWLLMAVTYEALQRRK